ncbi:MAG: hypothetical protein HY344_01175 [Candidatus Levybacteria bacterium]|nr:hypothetical protein [Candidatus Levybacteria bacterium]
MVLEIGREVPKTAALFPLGEDVSNRIFSAISLGEKSWEDVVNDQTAIMMRENPFALTHLGMVASGRGGISQEGFMIGFCLMYAILREKSEEGTVPELVFDFVEGYAKDKYEREEAFFDDPDLEFNEIEYQNTESNMFRLLERGLYSSLDKHLSARGGLFFDSRFIGIVYSYFLFRQGLSNPANYSIPA